jgi:hypothetical protein
MTLTLTLVLSLAVSGAPANLPATASLVEAPALSSTDGPTTPVVAEIALPDPLPAGVGAIEQQQACSKEGELRTDPTGLCCPQAGHELFITQECQDGSWVPVWSGCAVSSVCGWF